MKTLIATKIDGEDQQKSLILNQTSGSLYIHVPFCTKKCPYCHFFVLPYDKAAVTTYLNTLKLEWEMKRETFSNLISIYLGGGTPSLLEPNEVEEILAFIGKGAKEITLEANPENVTLEKMKAYKALGINRVSIGVQSLDTSSLHTIGRNHTSNKASEAVFLTRKAGIENISIDLMYDLPGQTLASWQRTIDLAAKLPITHLSLYNLTFEIGSLYYKQQKTLIKTLPDDETSLQMLEYAVENLEKSGLKRYEISAFARNGLISNHNTGYWTGRPFIGLGPSAFSYLKGSRFRNHANLNKWKKGVMEGVESIDFTETLPYPDNLHELLAVRLRLLEGVNLEEFPPLPKETHLTLNQLLDSGFIKKAFNRISLTSKGLLFYDSVASLII